MAHKLYPDASPSESDQCYQATEHDISYHVHIYTCKESSCTLQAWPRKLGEKEWEMEGIQSQVSILCQTLYVVTKQEESDDQFSTPLNSSYTSYFQLTLSGHFHCNSNGDKQQQLVGSSWRCSQTLLYVHQEEWKQLLIQWYGNNLSLIDATYKSIQYDLPLFFMAVRINVAYIHHCGRICHQVWNSFNHWRGSNNPKAVEFQVRAKLFHFWILGRRASSNRATISATAKFIYVTFIVSKLAMGVVGAKRKHGLSVLTGDHLLVSFLRNCAWAPPAKNVNRTWYRHEAYTNQSTFANEHKNCIHIQV